MLDPIKKSFYWFILSFLIVSSIAFFDAADTPGPGRSEVHFVNGPMVAGGVLSLCLVYVIGRLFEDMSKWAMLLGGVSIVISGILALYGPEIVFVLTGTRITMEFYFRWFVALFLFGMPFMTYVSINYWED